MSTCGMPWNVVTGLEGEYSLPAQEEEEAMIDGSLPLQYTRFFSMSMNHTYPNNYDIIAAAASRAPQMVNCFCGKTIDASSTLQLLKVA